MRNVQIVLAAAILLALPTSGAVADAGAELFRLHCAECHGEAGRGDGPKTERLGFAVRDLTLGVFKCRCTASGSPPTDDDIRRTVGEGIGGTAMRAFAEKLSESEMDAVIAYVKSLSPVFEAETPTCLPLPDASPDYAATAAEGAQIYKALSCWSCHGPAGRGDGPAAKTLIDAWGEPIRARNFVVLKKFKCGGEPRDLYRTLHTGLDGTPMASFRDALLFSGDDLPERASMAALFDEAQLDAYDAWASDQPSATDLAGLVPSERTALTERRTWALVAFLESLLAGDG